MLYFTDDFIQFMSVWKESFPTASHAFRSVWIRLTWNDTITNKNVIRSTWTDRRIIKKKIGADSIDTYRYSWIDRQIRALTDKSANRSAKSGIDRIRSIESVPIARLYFSMGPCQSNPYPPFISCYATQQYVPPAPSSMLSWSRVQYQTIIIDKF